MTKPLRIDFVSDVSCPWCAIGLGGLEACGGRVGDHGRRPSCTSSPSSWAGRHAV